MALETRIDAKGLLSQLDEETVLDYTAEGETVSDIIDDLLAMQLNANPITKGTIQPAGSTSLNVSQSQMLSVILQMRETIGGYIEVDNDRKLNWWTDIGEDKGQQLRYQKNIASMRRSFNYGDLGNRLYCYGMSSSGLLVKLSEVQAEDYVEDTDSQDDYGICVRRLLNKNIAYPATLLAWATLKLAELKEPRINYSLELVNLGEIEGFDFDKLQLGSIVKVIDETLDIEVETRAVKIRRNISEPLKISVELTNKLVDIIDTIADRLPPKEEVDPFYEGFEEHVEDEGAHFSPLSSIVFGIDGLGGEIATGLAGWIPIPFPCTIEEVTMLASPSGSIVIDIWMDEYDNFPPTDGDSITAAAVPTISGAEKSQDGTLTGWTKEIAKGDILAFNVDSCTDITLVIISLRIKREKEE